jgi:hypothetical protein
VSGCLVVLTSQDPAADLEIQVTIRTLKHPGPTHPKASLVDWSIHPTELCFLSFL